MEKCKRCGSKFESYNSLRRHVGRAHKINSTNFYVEYNLNGIWPVCKCGCGEKVKWANQIKNFRDYCAGHQSRIHNNWGHNKKAIAHSSATRREQFAKGERTVWNNGLTKENDARLQKLGEIVSDSYTDKRREMYAIRMSKMRNDGTIPTLYGSISSQWKGGVSSINCIARANKRLYDEWKYPILVRDGFKCTQCLNAKMLHIHHDKESMSEIVKKHVIDDIDPNNFELKNGIAEKIVDYHIKSRVSGITLCNECHGKLHPKLNFKH